MNKIGFMQGRLSPKPADRIQAFPKDSWRQEFQFAREIGFDCVELIYDDLYLEQNPLHTSSGRQELKRLAQETKVELRSICSDYFMIHRFSDPSPEKREKNLAHALELLDISAEVGCPLVEFPFVDSSSLKNKEDQDLVQPILEKINSTARKKNIRIAIETDLPPVDFRNFLNLFDDNLGANFDLGNSAALGYDSLAECRGFGSKIFNVHIKDRVLGGTTVPLLTGHTDFERAFQGLAKISYRGDFILQTCPDQDYLGIAAKYRKMVADWCKSLLDMRGTSGGAQ